MTWKIDAVKESIVKVLEESAPVPLSALDARAAVVRLVGEPISENMLARARRELGVRATKRGFGEGGVWLWRLPLVNPDAN